MTSIESLYPGLRKEAFDHGNVALVDVLALGTFDEQSWAFPHSLELLIWERSNLLDCRVEMLQR